MPDPRFFTTQGPVSVENAVALAGASLVAGKAGDLVSRVAAHDENDLAGAVVYCERAPLLAALKGRVVGLCFTTEALAGESSLAGAVASVVSPRLAFAQLADRLHRSIETSVRIEPSHISVKAEIDTTAVIMEGAELGRNVRLGPHVHIGPGVVLGDGCVVEAGASISHTLIGKNVRILPGARIGQAGFGFAESQGGLFRVPQLGRVVIGDDVEIGANTTIDRGALGDTVIGRGAKIDNLVQIGHNTRIGQYCVLAAQIGISGSCNIGDGVFMGGKVGVADHLTIGDGAQIAAGSGLMRDVPAGEKWGGAPARPVKDWLREIATLAKIAKKKNG